MFPYWKIKKKLEYFWMYLAIRNNLAFFLLIFAMMRLDSISMITEIAPFYGDLDDVFRLMKRLNIKANMMWDKIWVQLSNKIKRKRVEIEIEDELLNAEMLWNHPLSLILFETKEIYIDSKKRYEWLIELLNNFVNPKMIKMPLSFSFSENISSCVTFLWHSMRTNENEYKHLDLYNKVIQIVTKKGIDLSLITSYIFINEVPSLKKVKYISYILFQWNEKNNVDSMIKTLKELIKSKVFEYNSVKLIWDGMKLKDFKWIYTFLAKHKMKVHIVSRKNLQNLILFVNKASVCSNKIHFKMCEADECILWNWNINRDIDQNLDKINFKKWYYKPKEWSAYAMEIEDGFIKCQNNVVFKELDVIKVKQGKFTSLDFCFRKTFISDEKYIKFDNLINFKNNMVEISSSAITKWYFHNNKITEQLNILNKIILTELQTTLKIIYSFKSNKFQLIATEYYLNNEEVNYLEKIMNKLSHIYTVSVTIENPSSVIIFLNSCKSFLYLKSISLKLKNQWNLKESFEIRDAIVKLEGIGKRVIMHTPSHKTTFNSS